MEPALLAEAELVSVIAVHSRVVLVSLNSHRLLLPLAARHAPCLPGKEVLGRCGLAGRSQGTLPGQHILGLSQVRPGLLLRWWGWRLGLLDIVGSLVVLLLTVRGLHGVLRMGMGKHGLMVGLLVWWLLMWLMVGMLLVLLLRAVLKWHLESVC